jgi:hypothetical protein
MSRVEEIERAIQELSGDEFARIAQSGLQAMASSSLL